MGYEVERHGGEATTDDPHATQGAAPGKETLVEQTSGSTVATGRDAPRAATRIDAVTSGGGGADPFNFTGFAGGGATTGNAISGAATSSSANTVEGPGWYEDGRFGWLINWKTNGTSGWIVQKVTSTHTGRDSNNQTITPEKYGLDSEYYEAWAVDSKGNITPEADNGGHDRWQRPGFGEKSRGRWTIRGDVYWTSVKPANMIEGGVRAAGTLLLSSWTAPAGIGSVLQVRKANGTWDSRRGVKHTGTVQ